MAENAKVDPSEVARVRAMIFSPETPDYAFVTREELCAAFGGAAIRTIDMWSAEQRNGFPSTEDYPGMKAYPLAAVRAYLTEVAQSARKRTLRSISSRNKIG